MRAELRSIRWAVEARHVRTRSRMGPILAAFADRGLRAAATKGFAWAERLYPEPGLRPYLDVDLLVRPSDWAGVLDVLAEAGFRTDAGEEPPRRSAAPAWTLSPAFRKDGLTVELHPNPLGLQIPTVGEGALWEALREEDLGGVAALVPPWPYELCQAAVHAQQHSYGRLSWLVDMAEMAGRDDLDWAAAARLARAQGVEGTVAHGLRIVERGWPGSVPARGRTLFRTGEEPGLASRIFWPVEAVAARKPLPAAPYYMPSVFALLRRRRVGPAIRGLAAIFFPSGGWVARQTPGGSALKRAAYAAGRLLKPFLYVARRLVDRG